METRNNNFNDEPQKERISALSRMLIKSFNYADADPDSFLLNARKTTETICKFIYNKEIGEKSGKKMMLSDYGRELVSKKIIPERIGILIGTIQTYGNYGAHAQDDYSEASKEWIAPCQSALATLSNWFFLEYLKKNIPNELTQPLQDFTEEGGRNTKKTPSSKLKSLIPVFGIALGIIAVIIYFSRLERDKKISNEGVDYKNVESSVPSNDLVQNVNISQNPNPVVKKSPDAKRIAILYFDNNSGEAKLKGLAKGLTDMMITDLSKYYMLQVVERDKLEEILKEQKLSNSKSFDQTTAVKIGRLLGAEYILAGSYFELMNNLRIDARLIDVETGKIINSEGINGASTDFFDIEKKLVGEIITGLELTLKENEKEYLNSVSYKNFTVTTGLKYSRGLDYLDKGDFNKAKELIQEVLNDNPEFEPAMHALQQVEI